MTVYSLEKLIEIESENAKNGFELSIPITTSYKRDLTEIIPRTIAYMHSQIPSYYQVPLKRTIEDFAEMLVEDLGEKYFVRSDLVYSSLLDFGLDTEDGNDHTIRKDEDFHKISTRYSIFSGKLRNMSIWYPDSGDPLGAQAQREEKALEKTFCKK
jgi:hypothetical protein